MELIGPWEVILLLLIFVIPGIPAYVVGDRRRVEAPGIAFVPIVGPYIVVLRSIDRSGWLCVLTLVPLANIIFGIWLAFVVPPEHQRTRWWALPFLIPLVQLVAFYVYAFTLDRVQPAESVAVA